MSDVAGGPGDRAMQALRLGWSGPPGYELLEVIGRGGFGLVYRAHEPVHNRFVAIKFLTAPMDDEAQRLFERERTSMGAVSGHPHILTVYASGVDQMGRAYIVMDLMTGGTLADRLARDGPLPWLEVLDIGVKVSGALEAAHRRGILHRDLKPENVLLSGYGQPMLGDFGISVVQGFSHTRTGVFHGTPLHAACEVLLGEPSSVRSDVYSLASTLFQLLHGAPAFAGDPGEHPAATTIRVCGSPVPDLRPAVPDPVCAVLEQGLERDPDQRHESAAAFGRHLREVQRELGAPVTELHVPPLQNGGPGPAVDSRPARGLTRRRAAAETGPAGGDGRRPAPRPPPLADPTSHARPVNRARRLTMWSEPGDLTVDPGAEVRISIRVGNDGATPEVVELAVPGVPAEWVSIDPPRGEIEPSAGIDAVIRIQPPRLATTPPGRLPLVVVGWAADDPRVRCEDTRSLTITEYVDPAARIEPVPDRAGVFALTVGNAGNSLLEARLESVEGTRGLDVVCETSELQVPAGAEARIEVQVSPAAPGPSPNRPLPFAVRVHHVGGGPLLAEATYHPPPALRSAPTPTSPTDRRDDAGPVARAPAAPQPPRRRSRRRTTGVVAAGALAAAVAAVVWFPEPDPDPITTAPTTITTAPTTITTVAPAMRASFETVREGKFDVTRNWTVAEGRLVVDVQLKPFSPPATASHREALVVVPGGSAHGFEPAPTGGNATLVTYDVTELSAGAVFSFSYRMTVPGTVGESDLLTWYESWAKSRGNAISSADDRGMLSRPIISRL